jgi:hypothetical protein
MIGSMHDARTTLRRAAGPLGYLALAVLLLLPAWRHPATVVPGVDGDATLFRWFLGWTPWALAHGHDPFFTSLVHAPAGANLMWNTWMPLVALAAWPVTAAFGSAVSYTLLLTLGLALAAWSARCAALRFVVGDRVAAYAGGLAYGCSPYLLGQALGHLNYVLTAWVPPVVLLLAVDLLRGRRTVRRTGVLLGLVAAFAALTNEEVVATLVLVIVVALGIAALIWRGSWRPPVARLARAGLVAACVAAVVAAGPLAWQFLGPRRVTGVIQPGNHYVADLAGYVLPSRLLAVAPRALDRVTGRFTGNDLENGVFLGPLFVVALYVVLRYGRDRVLRCVGAVGLVALVLALGPRLHLQGGVSAIPLPWALVRRLPLYEHALSVRLVAYAYLALALLLAVFVARARASPVAAHRRGGLAVAAVALLAFAPRLPYPAQRPAVPAFFTGAGVRTLPPGSLVVVAPLPHDTFDDAAMLWQAESGYRFRMPYGYLIAPAPGGLSPFAIRPSPLATLYLRCLNERPWDGDPATVAAVREQLAGWRAAAFVVGPMSGRATFVAALTDVLGAPPEHLGGVDLWRLPP